ncbi:MAG: hypothetical protein IJ009_03235 [Clostridia bacterium]|nr:hypothetical protein [Clostridia bacterium]
MSQYSTLLGVIVGAAVVGATLAAKEIMDDPEKSAAVKEKLNNGYRKICTKVGQGCAAVRGKVAEGYAIAKEKATEGYNTAKEKMADGYNTVKEKAAEARDKVENSEPVRKIKKKVEDIRRAAEPASPYFREEEEETDAPAEEAEADPAAE